jgi:hypothetical protein
MKITQQQPKASTTQQRAYIMKLIGYDERTKEELVQWVTNDTGRTSLRSLDHQQADAVIKQLMGTNARANVHPWGAFNKDNPRHRKVLSLCQNYGWERPHPATGQPVADLDKLGQWLEQDPRCPVRKPLKKMDHEEVSKIITALEGMIKWKYR